MERIVAIAYWTRLDTDGRDACRLVETAAGWRLDGCATFLHDGQTCLLTYRVDCDTEWRTLSASVDGSLGLDRLAFAIVRSGDGWLFDGQVQPEAAGCVDLDLGFTPATNLLPIRRLAPRDGSECLTRAAYYREFVPGLGNLVQHYTRSGANDLVYRSPAHGFAATLRFHSSGFVTDYPGIWSGTVSTV